MLRLSQQTSTRQLSEGSSGRLVVGGFAGLPGTTTKVFPGRLPEGCRIGRTPLSENPQWDPPEVGAESPHVEPPPESMPDSPAVSPGAVFAGFP